MPRSTLVSLCLLKLIFLVNLSCTAVPTPTIDVQRPKTIDLTPCDFPKHKEPALCGKHAVYEDRASRSGRMILLNIVVLPAAAAVPRPDPVFYLTGGPGQGAARIAGVADMSLMRELRRERDIVLVDMRGTGDSPRLQCPSKIDRSKLQSFFPEIFEPATIRACREALEWVAELKFYTTSAAMDDLEEVRAALGYDKINLSGVSYGTLAALEYLRRHPQKVRAVALAGVLTPSAKMPLQFAKGGQRALERLFEDCAADPTCRKQFPDLRGKFATVLATFDQGPVKFEMAYPIKQAAQTVSLSRGVFTDRLRAMLTSHEYARMLPLVIDHAAAGNWATFARIALTTATPSAFGVTTGVYYSVTCSESVPAIRDEDIVRENQPTFLGDYRTRRHQQACAHWHRGEVPANFYEPVKSDLPVLMLSGDIDPATPPEIATAALSTLPNGRQVVLRNTPHSYTSQCARDVIAEFIGKGSSRELTVACAERLRRPLFLTELPARYNR